VADAVHLVVVMALRKAQQFRFKLRQEQRSLGEENELGLELMLVDMEPPTLVVLDRGRLDRPRQDFFELFESSLCPQTCS
jgi:hypothetical protein